MGLWSIIVGGVETNFDALGFYIAAPLGAGMPDPQIITQAYAVLDGAQFQRSRVPPRVLTLKGTLVGSSLSDLHTKRKALIAAVRRDNADPQAPVTLKYTGGTVNPVYISGYYETGLQLGERRGFSEQLGLRFVCTEPFFYGAAASQALAAQASITSGHLLRQSLSGQWDVIAGLGLILDLTVLASGDLLIMDSFGVQRWDGAALTGLGDAAANVGVEAASGDIYVGGTFTAMNGVAANRIARRSGSTWSALGTGAGARVRALAIGSDGSLYAGGDFDSMGGVANTPRIAKWDSSAWSALGTGGAGGYVLALVIGPDGALYAGGSFTSMGGVANTAYVAKWNGSAWVSLGVCNGNVWALAIGADGSLYAGGEFTSIGGTAASRIARWNGSAWSALGSGIVGTVQALDFAADGALYAAGVDMSSAGGIPCRLARWNGSAWFPLDIELATTNVGAVVIASSYRYIGHTNVATNQVVAGRTTVTNAGSAAVSPTTAITAPAGGRLYQLLNYTSGAAIYFNLDMLPGETVRVDTARKTVTSTYRGNLLRTVLAGSQLGRFALLPGANAISLFHASATATATMSWTNRYWSLDG